MPVSSLWSGPIKLLKRNLLSSLIPLSLHFLPLTEVAESWAGRARQSAGGSLSHDVPDGRPQRAESPEETAAGETRGRSVRKGTWVHVFWQDLHWCQMLYGFSQRCRPLQIGLFCLVFCWVVLNSRIFFCIPGESCGRWFRSLLLCSSVEYIWCQTRFVYGVSGNTHQNISQCLAGWQPDNWLHMAKTLTPLILETTCE